MGLFGRVIVSLLPLAPRFVVGWVAKRYTAGENLEQALDMMRKMASEGACFTIDVLGEEIKTIEESSWFINEYESVIDSIVDSGIDANISIKPTALGLLINEKSAHSNIERIVRKASENKIFVRLDMEDHRATQATIDAALAMHNKGLDNIGVVLQGRMFRTPEDVSEICNSLGPKSDFRICKGIYLEPPEISFTSYRDIVDATNRAIDLMLDSGAYTAIASHDFPVIEHALKSLESRGLGPGKTDSRHNPPASHGEGKGPGYEFQFLLGVRGNIRRDLSKKGHRTRIYLPYGEKWYEYGMRRLRENPGVAVHVTKSLLMPWTNRR
jgi:proline dehydrogenase